MQTIPDSNVILDLISGSQPWFNWSQKWLRVCSSEAPLVTNAIIFSEATAQISQLSDASRTMAALGLTYEDIPSAAAHLAGQAHRVYRQRGGSRSRTLPDFLIGAHAASKGYRLMTRDGERYRTYFPDLTIIAPDTHP